MAESENKNTVEQPFYYDYVIKARNEKIDLQRWVLPNWFMFSCDTEVHLGVYGMTVKADISLIFELEEDFNKPKLFFISSDDLAEMANDFEEKINAGEIEAEREIDDGNGVIHREYTEPVSFSIELSPLKAGERHISFIEYLIWLAVELADSTELKSEIIHSAYSALTPENIGEIIIAIEREKRIRDKAPRRDRKKKYSSPTKEIKWPNDPVTIALMDRNEGHIEPSDYFGGERDINTGGGGSVKLTVSADESIEIDADESLYVLDNETYFWYSMLLSKAIGTGKKEIYGTDILKMAHYQNPYRDECAEVMESAANNIFKAMRTTISVDTTNERRNKRRKNRELIESIGLRSVISADMDLTTEKITDDEGKETGEIVRDFVVTLKPRDDGEIITAFPLLTYADSRDMILTFTESEFSFDGLRLSLDDRRMWMYVLRRVKSQKLSNTIKFETMWNTLELKPREYIPVPETDENGEELKDANGNIIYKQEDKKIIARKQSEAMRKKKQRMISQLEKMLYQAAGGLGSGQKMKKGETPKYPRRIASWEWTKNKNTGRVDGVKITPLKSAT